jgi:hypothetical protein
MKTYQELQKEYPGKEIKLIPKEYEAQYKQWGFTTILEFKQGAFGKEFDYCFIVEA